MHEVVETIRNEDAANRSVVIEPWGMPLRLPPGRAFKLIARGPADGKLEILRRPGTVIVGGVPSDVEKRSGAFFRLMKCTTNRPPWQAATGGTRHAQQYQGSGASAGA
jgi:hypothetical protein